MNEWSAIISQLDKLNPKQVEITIDDEI